MTAGRLYGLRPTSLLANLYRPATAWPPSAPCLGRHLADPIRILRRINISPSRPDVPCAQGWCRLQLYLIVGIMYFAMAFPLSLAARRLERTLARRRPRPRPA